MAKSNGPKMGELRRTQLVSTHGPGAVVDYLAERGGEAVAGVTLGLDRWNTAECRKVVDPALQRMLGVRQLNEPPVSLKKSDANGSEYVPALPAARFPEWLECPVCHYLQPADHWRKKNMRSAVRLCSRCTDETGKDVAALPARFMVICDGGHLADFPWMDWVEHDHDCKRRGKMRLENKGAGLRNLFLRCVDCGQQHPMTNAVTNVGRALKHCPAGRPWLGDTDPEGCTRRPMTALRGSANLYFPAIASALTIPPWTDDFRERLAQGGLWDALMDAKEDFAQDDDPEDYERSLKKIARRLARMIDPDAPNEVDARASIDAFLAAYAELPATAESEPLLRKEEWLQFLRSEHQDDRTFETRAEAVPPHCAAWFDAFVRVPRLREVRVLRGFTRRYPPNGTSDPPVAPITRDAKWLPVMETLGEGVFIALNEESLALWERDEAIQSRAEELHWSWVKEWRERYKRHDEPPTKITPRLLLVHGIAHALMLELSITCGYGTASLQERLYVSEPGDATPMAGLLIYTASSDSDGTLGGLEREGLSTRLAGSLQRAVARMQWCSSDPLCLRGISSTSDTLNGAACHSCLFVSETSCELFNRSLDRVMMIGNGSGMIGYFAGFADDRPC